jgi:hypothetical protein
MWQLHQPRKTIFKWLGFLKFNIEGKISYKMDFKLSQGLSFHLI